MFEYPANWSIGKTVELKFEQKSKPVKQVQVSENFSSHFSEKLLPSQQSFCKQTFT